MPSNHVLINNGMEFIVVDSKMEGLLRWLKQNGGAVENVNGVFLRKGIGRKNMAKHIAKLTPRAIKIVGPRLAARATSKTPTISFKTPFGIGALAKRLHTRTVIRNIAQATARVARSRRK